MGLGPSKEKIRKILEHSITNSNISEQKNLKIEYKFIYAESAEAEDNPSAQMKGGENAGGGENESFIFSQEVTQVLDNPKLDVKNLNKFPYNSVGTISVKFPVSDAEFVYTCFLIDTNVVVTLASNLESNSKGGKAKSITTSFSKEPIKWENIHIQGEETKGKGKKDKDKDKGKNETLDNVSSKLAVILFDDNVGKEWLGVEGGKKEDFEGRDIFAVFSFKDQGKQTTTTDGEENTPKSSSGQQKFREIFILETDSKQTCFLGLLHTAKDVAVVLGYYEHYDRKSRIASISCAGKAFCSPDTRFLRFTVPASISEEPLIEMNGMAFLSA